MKVYAPAQVLDGPYGWQVMWRDAADPAWFPYAKGLTERPARDIADAMNAQATTGTDEELTP
jgi:hypothetical protein